MTTLNPLIKIIFSIKIDKYQRKKNWEILAQQKLKLNYIKQWKKEETMEQARFIFETIHNSQKFHIYRKKQN